jgi:hypothetical protein
MYRFLFRFTVMTISVLSAQLLVTWITGYVMQWKHLGSPYVSTLAGMGLVTLVLFPLFAKLQDWVDAGSKKIVNKGRSMGGRYLGLLLSFLLCLAVLFYFYLKMWFGLDLVGELMN